MKGGGVAKMRLDRKDDADQLIYSEGPEEPHKASFWYQLAAVVGKRIANLERTESFL